MAYIAAMALALLGAVFLILACIEISTPDPWTQKWRAVLEWLVAAAPLLISVQKLWKLARGYQHNVVRIDASAVTIHTMGGKDFHIPIAQIRAVKWEPAKNGRGVLVIDTQQTTYKFDLHACPRADTVARLIAERIA
jgi:hypothetical protein